MRVLVTNDDGWYAPGLQTLVRSLGKEHDVYVAAPSSNHSGSGLALGHIADGHVLRAEQVTVAGAQAAWAIEAPPAMCVYAALTALCVEADVVVSGINAGHNTGANIGHSGTFGGAWMAARWRIPAIALSVGYEPAARFDTGAIVASWLVERSPAIPRGRVLNVNVPDVDASDLGSPHDAPLASAGLQRLELTRSNDGIHVRELVQQSSPGDTAVVLDAGLSMTLVHARFAVEPVPTALLLFNAKEPR